MIVNNGFSDKYLKYICTSIIFVGMFITFSIINKLKDNVLTINEFYFLLSVTCGILVYCADGPFLLMSLKVFNEKVPLLHSLKYALTINPLGNLVSFGGATPFALQILMLKQHNISTKKATLARIINVIFFGVSFNILLIVSLVYILLDNKQNQFNLTMIIAALFLFFIFLSGFYLIIFWKKLQTSSIKVIFNLLDRIVRIFSRKVILNSSRVETFLDEINEGFKTLIRKPCYLFLITGITIIDRIFWLGVIYFAFLTMSYPINIGLLIIGFSIGQIVGIISMVPGGFGTMEVSMALTYKALGIPFNIAFAAIIIYRLSFYIIPFIISLPLYLNIKPNFKGS